MRFSVNVTTLRDICLELKGRLHRLKTPYLNQEIVQIVANIPRKLFDRTYAKALALIYATKRASIVTAF
jgi:hypothetical protein